MIWLMRHAHAEDGSPDADRPLSVKGREQARKGGQALARLGIRLDACVTSPKVRARDTAELACEALGLTPVEDTRLSGGPFDAKAICSEHGEEVLLVGHEPDFSAAVHTLCGAQVRMPKAAVAGIDRGELKVFLRPAELAVLSSSSAD